MRATATLHLTFIEDHRLQNYQLPTLGEQLENIFALTASLSKALENQRLKLVDQKLVQPVEEGLITKEDLKTLDSNQKMEKQLHGRGYGFGRGKGKGGKGHYHPYYSSQWHGKGGKGGKGKGGKGKGYKPKFQFKAPVEDTS